MSVQRRTLAVALSIWAIAACSETTAPDVPMEVPGFGTPVADGNVETAEWSNAQVFQVFDETPELVGSVLYVLNDATNVYFGLSTPFPNFVPTFEVRFDNNGDGVRSIGEDRIAVDSTGFYDTHLGDPNYGPDSQRDGSGAMTLVGGVVHAELAHPLSSGDPDDIDVAPGQTISICLRFLMPDFRSGSAPDQCFIRGSQSYMPIQLASGS